MIIGIRRAARNDLLWLLFNANPVLTAQGEVAEIIVTFMDVTARIGAERAVRENAAFTEAVLDSIPSNVVVLDERGTIIAVNSRWRRSAQENGGEPSGYLGWNYLTCSAEPVLRQDSAQTTAAADGIRGVLAGTLPVFALEYPSPAPDRMRWLLMRVLPLRGPRRGVVVSHYEITERKLAEDALRSSEKRFKALFEQAAVGVAVTDVQTGRYLQVNRRYCEIVERSEAELLAITPAEIAHPESAERDRELVRRLAAGEVRDFTVEKRYLRKDGSIVSTSITVSAMWAPGAPPDTMMAVVQDIAERKKAEARLRRLVESNAQSVFFWNSRGQITDANDAFLGLIGRSRDELAAGLLTWTELTPPKYAEVDRRAVAVAAAKGVCEPYEKEYLHKDGSRIPIIIGAATFADNPEEGVSYVVDLTDRKRLEKQFLRAQRMESIGTLAGGIAHDLNNILTPIMMSIELLKASAETPQLQRSVAAIETSTRRGADIVRQVLSFARGMDGERIEIQPKHLLNDLETIIRHTLPKDIRLQFSLAPDPWTIVGDPTQIHQILLNLCVNARDAMPAGGSLTISAENCTLDDHYIAMNPQARAGRYVLISVADTGTGIAPEIIDRIYEPFFTTKEINKSTGLGLSTVMAIVKSHRGIVNVYSEVGQGTTFKVYLPAQESASTAQENLPDEGRLPRGKGETILVVDDEASIRTITSQTLQAFGYRTVTAADGADGVAVYAEGRQAIAAVITDMMMPVMGGLAMIHALRRINPKVKVVASSGLAGNHAAAELMDTQVDGFMVKPYTAEILLQTLRTALDRA
jgi:PAS domain S-box-containing protein